MSTLINALNSNQINYAEFVRITLPTQTITLCNAAGAITVNGISFTGLGSLLQIGEIQRNVKANSADLQVSLTGIDPTNVGLVLGSQLKGSKIEIWRGFLNSDNQIITTPTTQFFKRYQGIINNVAINEDFNDQIRQRIATCVVTSASMRSVLDARVAGIKTNSQSWREFYPNDTSMDRVAVIATTSFDFGKQPVASAGYFGQANDQSATPTEPEGPTFDGSAG
jgi:hypothetical protein